jgi:hypothetical protein
MPRDGGMMESTNQPLLCQLHTARSLRQFFFMLLSAGFLFLTVFIDQSYKRSDRPDILTFWLLYSCFAILLIRQILVILLSKLQIMQTGLRFQNWLGRTTELTWGEVDQLTELALLRERRLLIYGYRQTAKAQYDILINHIGQEKREKIVNLICEYAGLQQVETRHGRKRKLVWRRPTELAIRLLLDISWLSALLILLILLLPDSFYGKSPYKDLANYCSDIGVGIYGYYLWRLAKRKRFVISENGWLYYDRTTSVISSSWSEVEQVELLEKDKLTIFYRLAASGILMRLRLREPEDISAHELASLLGAHANLPYYHTAGGIEDRDEIWSRTPVADENT